MTAKIVAAVLLAVAATVVFSLLRHRPRPEAAPQLVATATAPAAPPPASSPATKIDSPPSPAAVAPPDGAATFAGDGACTVAKGPSPIADACRRGGRAAAKQTMKEIVRRARAQGIQKACDNCHVDVDDYALLPDARTELAALLRGSAP